MILSPLEFIEKLSALVPLPYLHLTRYSGVLAPNSRYRSTIIPGKTRAQIKQERIENDVPVLQRGSWAKLLARVFMIDVTTCAQCGGEVKAIAVIFEKSVTSKILLRRRSCYVEDPVFCGSQSPTSPSSSSSYNNFGVVS